MTGTDTRTRAHLSLLGMGAAVLLLSACGNASEEETDGTILEDTAPLMEEAVTASTSLSLYSIVDDPARRGDNMKRDQYRHPIETLNFFGLEPDMTVVEIWPGGGWYTDILAPFVASGGGKLYAAHFDPEVGDFQARSLNGFKEKYLSDPDYYGDIEITAMSGTTGAIAPDNSADMVLTFRNVHNWRLSGFEQKAFHDMYAALKPGGILGVVAHRLPESAEKEGPNTWGYTKESTVKLLAARAGFEFVDSSEINANPKDIADHPYGVRTLQPASVTPKEGEEVPEGFDADYYFSLGESDRMTLKFRKPVDADSALLE